MVVVVEEKGGREGGRERRSEEKHEEEGGRAGREAERASRRPPVRVFPDFFYPPFEARVADAGLDPDFVLLQSPNIFKHFCGA